MSRAVLAEIGTRIALLACQSYEAAAGAQPEIRYGNFRPIRANLGHNRFAWCLVSALVGEGSECAVPVHASRLRLPKRS
ncbi:MAG: hypothetical protein RMI91_13375 [Gemmatales bacterium]|nr:hypothetical protein [Gemmatales bacterium]MDW7995636.1 hypothetical protein [Gemmatales bacterium]